MVSHFQIVSIFYFVFHFGSFSIHHWFVLFIKITLFIVTSLMWSRSIKQRFLLILTHLKLLFSRNRLWNHPVRAQTVNSILQLYCFVFCFLLRVFLKEVSRLRRFLFRSQSSQYEDVGEWLLKTLQKNDLLHAFYYNKIQQKELMEL